MRKTLFFAGLIISQAISAQSVTDTTINHIKNLTREWYQAVVNRDSVTIDRILADDYTVNGSFPKKNWINNVLHHFKMDSFEVTGETQYYMYADAIFSEGLLYWKGTNEGKPFMNAIFSVRDIWVKKNGQWRIHMRLLKFVKEK